jgi:beta-lactamase class A
VAPPAPPVKTATERPAPTPSPEPSAVERAIAEAGVPAGAVVLAPGAAPRPVGSLRAVRAWSTIKVPLLVAYLDLRGGAAKLSEDERDAATQMITVSANEPANRFFLALAGANGGTRGGARAIERVLRRGGDERTRVDARPPDDRRTFTWLGQTRWRLDDGAVFHRALFEGDVTSAADTRYVVGLMRRVIGSDWGLRVAVPETVGLAYKVGIGAAPDGTITAEQYGIAGTGASACVVGIAAEGPDERTAKAAVTGIARAALPRPAAGCAAAPARG